MCGANTGSLGLRTNAASRIHDSFRPVPLLKSQPSCCTSDKTTPWLNGRGTVENTTASSNCMHNQDTIATLLRESALLKASSSLPSLTSLVSSIVGSRDSSRCCKDSTYIHHVPINTLTCPPQISSHEPSKHSTISHHQIWKMPCLYFKHDYSCETYAWTFSSLKRMKQMYVMRKSANH
jgi:hypothetical protein